MEVIVTSSDVDSIVRAIRANADAKAIRRDLYRGLNSVTKPVRSKMVDAIPNALPTGGGLASQMQSMVSGRASAKGGRYAGVSIRYTSKGYDIRTLTAGRLRHPVFGNSDVWVDQTAGVHPDEFTKVFEREKPIMRRAVLRVLDDIARKVTN